MFDTMTLKTLCRRLLGATSLIACLATAGCIDNSGNKTYPPADAAADAPADTGAAETADDAPAAETANDVPASDTPTDLPASDSLPSDTGAADVHADTASGG